MDVIYKGPAEYAGLVCSDKEFLNLITEDHHDYITGPTQIWTMACGKKVTVTGYKTKKRKDIKLYCSVWGPDEQ